MTVPEWLMVGLIFFILTVYKVHNKKMPPMNQQLISAATLFMILGPIAILLSTIIIRTSND